MVCLPLIAERNAHEICLTQECLQIVRRLLWKQTTTHSIRNNNAMFEKQPLSQFKGPSQYNYIICHTPLYTLHSLCCSCHRTRVKCQTQVLFLPAAVVKCSTLCKVHLRASSLHMMPTSHLSGLIRPCLMPRNLNQVSDGGESEADEEVHVYFCYLVIAFPPLFPHSIIYTT